MVKILVKKEELKKRLLEKDLKDFLTRKYQAFVLVTCSEENDKGEMQVELSYDGDEDLVAYLLQGAAQVFDGEESLSKDSL
ncbi:MAG: hypothetical protein WC371_03770 [Parachlamydiales bacterium]